jgi:AraC family transcriptional regulator of adaptative response/methylated-DNA-[protein]-cysteine methyltransferase
MMLAMKQHNDKNALRSSDTERWQAVVRRDPHFDGIFYYAVATTGVYCRPSCAARLARQENVSFYESCAAAEAAGYRACKRCKPNAASQSVRNVELVAAACRAIDEAEEPPSLSTLAEAAGLSRYHFHRIFKGITGLTPKGYASASRVDRLRHGLMRGATVTEAIYEAGFGSSSRFYEGSDKILGMMAKDYRDGGRDSNIRFAVGECSLGSVLVAATERGVCAISFGDDPDALVRDLEDRFPKARLVGGDSNFDRIVAAVIASAESPRTGLDLPLDVRGTAFQHRVWQALRGVPAGETVTYAELAARLGSPEATRAVARACATNPIALAIPCHRVVRKDGIDSGYRWGIERKRTLLKREAAMR